MRGLVHCYYGGIASHAPPASRILSLPVRTCTWYVVEITTSLPSVAIPRGFWLFGEEVG